MSSIALPIEFDARRVWFHGSEKDLLDFLPYAQAHMEDPMVRKVIVSAVRFVLRQGFYEINWIPVIKEVLISEKPNEFGDEVFATLQYNSFGNMTSLGGKVNPITSRVEWQVYID